MSEAERAAISMFLLILVKAIIKARLLVFFWRSSLKLRKLVISFSQILTCVDLLNQDVKTPPPRMEEIIITKERNVHLASSLICSKWNIAHM